MRWIFVNNKSIFTEFYYKLDDLVGKIKTYKRGFKEDNQLSENSSQKCDYSTHKKTNVKKVKKNKKHRNAAAKYKSFKSLKSKVQLRNSDKSPSDKSSSPIKGVTNKSHSIRVSDSNIAAITNMYLKRSSFYDVASPSIVEKCEIDSLMTGTLH